MAARRFNPRGSYRWCTVAISAGLALMSAGCSHTEDAGTPPPLTHPPSMGTVQPAQPATSVAGESASSAGAHTSAGAPLTLQQTIPLPNVTGRLDHMSLDLARHRLFVAALGNSTVEVIDLTQAARVQSLAVEGDPQGVEWLPDAGRLVISSGAGGDCAVYDAALKLQGAIALGEDADNLHAVPAVPAVPAGASVASVPAAAAAPPAATIWAGYGDGGLAELDLQRTPPAVKQRIALAAHPEGFVAETAGARIFVNLPNTHAIAVVDRTLGKLVATWPLERARANFPVALDETHHRLFVGCRRPAQLLCVDTQTGTLQATVELGADADDLFFDASTRRLYAICGVGEVRSFAVQTANTAAAPLEALPTLSTRPGARTGLWDAANKRLYVAVPNRDGQSAEIRVYAAP